MSDTPMIANSTRPSSLASTASHLFKSATKGQWKAAAMVAGGVALAVIAVVAHLHGVSLFTMSAGAGALVTIGMLNWSGKAYSNHLEFLEFLQKEQQNQARDLSHRNAEYHEKLEETQTYC